MSDDECLKKKSTDYSGEVPIPYTIKLSFCLGLDCFSPDPDASPRSCFPAHLFLTPGDKESEPPMKILHLSESHVFHINPFLLLSRKTHTKKKQNKTWKNKSISEEQGTESCSFPSSQPTRFLTFGPLVLSFVPHGTVREQLCRYLAVPRVNLGKRGSCFELWL